MTIPSLYRSGGRLGTMDSVNREKPEPDPEIDITDATSWPEFMTIPEVAKVMRVTEQTVRNLMSSGKIDVHKFGGSVRIPKAMVLPQQEPKNRE